MTVFITVVSLRELKHLSRKSGARKRVSADLRKRFGRRQARTIMRRVLKRLRSNAGIRDFGAHA